MVASVLRLPKNIDLTRRLAALFEESASNSADGFDKLQRAIEHMSQLIVRGGGVDVKVIRAKLRVMLARYLPKATDRATQYEAAVTDLSSALKAQPHHVEALLYRGTLEAKVNRKQALDDLTVLVHSARTCLCAHASHH